MKLRKGILSILIISVMLIAIGISTTVKAEMVEPPMYLGIEEYRKKDSNNKEYAYSVLDKIVWKITSYDDDERSNPNKNKTLYCIKPGQGFGSRLPDGTYVGRNEVRIYNQKFDLKNRSQIEGNYLSAIPSGSVYNSLIWILEHCYVPEIDTNGDDRKQLLNSAKDYNRNVLGIEDKIYFEKLTDEDIDVVQQLAIWQFTNNNEDYQIPSNTFELYLKEKNKSEDYTSISNKFPTNDEGFRRNEAAIALYNYLVAKARENGNTEPLPTTTQNPISIDTTNSTIKLEGENYILGPYSISEITNNIEYVLEATLKNGETPVTFKILNTNKIEVELKDVVGSQFYISVPSSQYASGLKFSVTTKTNEKTLTYWSVNNAPLTDQPVVEIGKTEKNYVVSITTPNIPKEKTFDLALRKFITKINETEYDRVPKTSKEQLEKLNNGTWTVEKEHTKVPLVVKTGDRVLYTIRIYNEGEINGTASKITDYLPVGLRYIQDSQINIDNGWTVSSDGRTIVTEKLSGIIINAFDGTTLAYKDVQIECEVVAIDTGADQILKNVAEITECKDENGKAVTDRDSVPADLTEDQKQNYNPGESEKGWGYYDDDDYEDLKISAKVFDLALRKFITKINETEYDRVPKTSKEQLDTLNNGKQTVEKEHTKEPLIVKTGDRVLYTIRIYNEGEMNGKASKITDYLPIGLKFIQDSQINIDNGWTVSNDGRTVETEKLSETIINAFDGTILDYKDVQIECEVVAVDTGADQILKNIAEITGCTDAYGNNVTDRDSVPGDLTQDQKQNYNPGESEKGWGYYDDDDYEDLKMPGKQFDLSLRKFITQIDEKQLVDNNGKYIKEPVVDITNLKAGTATTATYKHQKAPVGVSENSEVIYTIRVYNEGQLDGYVTEITDYLPPELEFVNDEFNAQYGWTSNGRVVKTDITSPNTKLSSNQDTIYATRNNESEDKVLLKAFDGEKLDYIDVKIKCKVVNVEKLDTIITNIAEITAFTDSNGNVVIDRDSTQDSLTNDNSKDQDDIKDDNLPQDSDLPDYKGRDTNKSILTDSTYHYKGQQDDDDFDKLILQEFDLALRKFITSVNDEKVTNRYPVFTTNKDENGNYIYVHTKEPIEVETTDLVEYTIRIYNEGNVAGYAKEVKDNIPNGLEFVPENDTNKEYRWIMLDEQGNETNDVSKAKYITTDYLSKEQEKDGENIIKGFDQETMGSPEYKDVKVVFKVIAPSTYEGIITNIAEISDDSDENGNPVIDKDSEPNNNDEKEDDIDVEHIKLSYFDLALRKFITAVNENEITNRYPQFSIDEDGNYIYTHTKEPVEVENGNIVTYTLRIYNEGTKAGYAKQVKDDLPEGLEFLPENEINKEYRWIMLDEEGNETDNLEKAVSISTDYLSKAQETEGRDNLLKPFDANSMEEPDYRDIKIAFKVTEPNTSDRILINKAQIADDEDKDGKPVIDIDSTPDKWIEGEDDQDIEKVKVKYFDLALRKWVTQAIVIENGKEKVIETGHKAEDDPEEVVKVEIEKSKIDKVVVKFRYKIRVTNEGEIPGYATEISDYIPQGLKFVAADNKNWKEVDGKIVTNALANTLLKPGESAEVEVLLTWINGASNMGLKVNTAEISKDKNDSDTPDIDSVPNNKKPGEDDIDDAPVILATKTGELINLSYITLGTISLAIIGAGVMLIKKYVL